MKGFWDFVGRFQYDPKKALWIGVEREGFLFNDKGNIRPMAHLILQSADGDSRFTYELSACQIESRIGHCLLSGLANELQDTEESLNKYVAESNQLTGILPGLADWVSDYPEERLAATSYSEGLGLHVRYLSVAPESMPLDVYPDETGRYQKITQNMPRDILSAACRVAGTHIHMEGTHFLDRLYLLGILKN